jgi:hypothetical protein
MVIIDGDVLKDLRRSEFVTHTMINGRVYDAATMNEVGSDKKRPPFFFETQQKFYLPNSTKEAMEEKARFFHWTH